MLPCLARVAPAQLRRRCAAAAVTQAGAAAVAAAVRYASTEVAEGGSGSDIGTNGDSGGVQAGAAPEDPWTRWTKCIRVGNVARSTLPADIVRYFKHTVSRDAIRFEYNADAMVCAWWVAFESEEAWARAQQAAAETRLVYTPTIQAGYPVDMMRRRTEHRQRQTMQRGPGGALVIAEGLDDGVTVSDCLAFLTGYNTAPLPVTVMKTGHSEEGSAIFSLASEEEAQRLVRERSWGFIGNKRVRLRVLY
eukprot:jgi/Tetstr1/426498/TSEL_016798.t1